MFLAEVTLASDIAARTPWLCEGNPNRTKNAKKYATVARLEEVNSDIWQKIVRINKVLELYIY